MASLSPTESAFLRETIETFFSDGSLRERARTEGYDVNTTFTPQEFKVFSKAFVNTALGEIKTTFNQRPSWDATKEPVLLEAASPLLSDKLRSACTLASQNPLYYPPSNGFTSKLLTWIFG